MTTLKAGYFWKLLPVLSLLATLLLAACGTTTSSATPGVPTITAGSATTQTNQTTGATKLQRLAIYNPQPLKANDPGITVTLAVYKQALDDFTQGTGRIGDFAIDLVTVDDAGDDPAGWNSDLAKSVATRAANDPDTIAYLGPSFSAAAQVAIPILNQAGIPMLASSTTYPGLTRAADGITRAGEPEKYYPNPLRNFFRITNSDDLQGGAIVELLKTLKVEKAFLIRDSGVYGKGLNSTIVLSCNKLSIDCSKSSAITGQETDYSSLAQGIKTINPDAIVISGNVENNIGKLIADLRGAGLSIPIVGGDGLFNSSIIKDAGAASEGLYITNSGIPMNELPAKGQQLWKKFQPLYGDDQFFNVMASYEQLTAVLVAIKKAGVKDRKAVLTAISTLQNYEGYLGTWSFNKEGDFSLGAYAVYKVVGGQWKYTTVVKTQT